MGCICVCQGGVVLVHEADETLDLRILVDHSIVEVYAQVSHEVGREDLTRVCDRPSHCHVAAQRRRFGLTACWFPNTCWYRHVHTSREVEVESRPVYTHKTLPPFKRGCLAMVLRPLWRPTTCGAWTLAGSSNSTGECRHKQRPL